MRVAVADGPGLPAQGGEHGGSDGVRAADGALTVRLAEHDRTFNPYLEQTLNDVADDASSLQTGFDAVQSLSAASDALAKKLDDLMTQSTGALGDLLTAARREQLDQLRQQAAALAPIVAALAKLEALGPG